MAHASRAVRPSSFALRCRKAEKERRYLTPAATACYWRRALREWATVQQLVPKVGGGVDYQSFLLMGEFASMDSCGVADLAEGRTYGMGASSLREWSERGLVCGLWSAGVCRWVGAERKPSERCDARQVASFRKYDTSPDQALHLTRRLRPPPPTPSSSSPSSPWAPPGRSPPSERP